MRFEDREKAKDVDQEFIRIDERGWWTTVPAPVVPGSRDRACCCVTSVCCRSTMQRLIARGSCRGGLGSAKASVPGAAWRSSPKTDTTGVRLGDSASRTVYTWKVPIPLTKIVATIGPVSEQFEPLQKVRIQPVLLLLLPLLLYRIWKCWK